MLTDPIKTEQILSIFEETQKLFIQTDTLYLDKKQIIMTLLLSLSEVLRDD